jgi:hypothetical protein
LKGIISALLFALSSLSAVSADDVDKLLDYIGGKVLSVSIELKLLDNNREISWDAESQHATVMGRSVNLRLVAEELIIEAYITPFGDFKRNLVLVANGEIWFSDRENSNSIRYESFIKSLPMKPDEKVIFFPLGVAVDSETNIYTLQMEISIEPYEEFRPTE